MDEGLAILSRLWSEESVSFTGAHYQLEEASIAPRPIQKPLPLWVGGSSPKAIERTARWGTGWQAGIDSADPETEGEAEFQVEVERSPSQHAGLTRVEVRVLDPESEQELASLVCLLPTGGGG